MDFDYKRCIDVRGRFNISKTKVYLREIGCPESAIPYIKEHHALPQEEHAEAHQNAEFVYDHIAFNYNRCADGKGKFNEDRARQYLKSAGIVVTDAAVEYLRDHFVFTVKPVVAPKSMSAPKLVAPPPPQPPPVAPPKAVEKPVENEVVKGVVEVATGIAIGAGVKTMVEIAQDAVGYAKECWIGSKQCRECSKLKRDGRPTHAKPAEGGPKKLIEGALNSKRLTPQDLRREEHICNENPWKVPLIGTCRKHESR